MKEIPLIEVLIWGKRVGAVAMDPKAGCYAFEYADRWKSCRVELAPLTMPLTRASGPFLFPSLSKETYKGLPGLLADCLPDDFGNALIDAWMARKGVKKDAITTLNRLAYMGKRGMGALTFKPSAGSKKESAEPLQMKAIVEAARKLMSGDLSNDVSAQTALANIIQVGTSAGGARAKAVVAWNESTNELRSGQFDVPEGFEHWLLKFDGVGKDLELGTGGNYGRIEYAYHLMAKAAGITMERCRLFEENGRAHFMTRRFDRDGNARHHIQSLCAMAHLDYKQRATHSYEQLFNTIASLELGDKALDQAFRRMVLNVIASNNDDHTKNFAFRLKEGGEWELAPAYDITHAYNPKGVWTYQHLMSVNGKFGGIHRADMLEVAERYLVPDAKVILDQVEAACSNWLSFAAEAGLPIDEVARVGADIHSLS